MLNNTELNSIVPPRELKELIPIVISNLKYIKNAYVRGICYIIRNLTLKVDNYGKVTNSVITITECNILHEFIYANRPANYEHYPFFFKPGLITPRRRFLKQLLKQLN